MAAIISKTDSTFHGPWLVDRSALEALDRIVDDEAGKLKDKYDLDLRKEVEERLGAEEEHRSEDRRASLTEYLRSQHKYSTLRTTRIRFASPLERRVEVERFSEAFRMPELLHERAIAFDVILRCGTVRAKIEAKSVVGWVGDLSLNVEPEGDFDAKELYMALADWARAYGPKPYERIWLQLKPFAFFVALALMVCLFVWKAAVAPVALDPNKREAYALLDKGIKAGDELKAIETLLALESDYKSSGSRSQTISLSIDKADIFIMAYILVTWWVLAIAPTIILGIGDGSRRIALMRFIGKYFFISIPLCLFGILIKPHLEGALRSAFKF